MFKILLKNIGNASAIEISSRVSKFLVFGSFLIFMVEVAITKSGYSIMGTDKTLLEKFMVLAPYMATAFFFYIYISFSKIEDALKQLHKDHHGILEVLSPKDVPNTDALKNGREIKILTLSGSLFNPISNGDLTEIIDKHRLKKLRLLIADPFSDKIKDRYAYDEASTATANPEIITNRILDLHTSLVDIDQYWENKIDVKVYPNYPVISVLQVDKEVFSRNYSFKLRANDTPVLRAEVASAHGLGIIAHFDNVWENSISLSQWVCKNYHELSENRELPCNQFYSGVFLKCKNSRKYIFYRRPSNIAVDKLGKLNVFGDRKKDNETPLETAKRGLAKETGLEIPTNRFKHIQRIPFADIDRNHTLLMCDYYVVSNIDQDKIELPSDTEIETYTKIQAKNRTDLDDFLPSKLLSSNILS